MQVGCQSGLSSCKRAIRYLIRGISVKTKEKKRLMTGVNYKAVSEPGELPVEKISRCQARNFFRSLKCL